ncbi:CD276 antigen-like isoform X1 [Oncorhynchus tshawytscha]|uniref:CD276 antigen-like isoform X1 n=2 Tax=Oncorhynchus tshawytscha TaxID=74940 RepID=UPI001C3C1D93|nr:CD276 antigen-like isoform X1 [Oncorhynchus tshawytscha]
MLPSRHMGLHVVSVLFITMISSVVTTTSLQPREVAAPGSDFTLNCSFPSSKNLNLNQLVINWQRGESEVVHSYYHGRDQLERQSGVYKGRTHLFEDQLTVGNASLRLSGVQPSDQGQYTCDVTDEQGGTLEKLQLLVAAPYDEPRISAQATCDGFIVTLHASQGFPQPELVWKGVMDSNTTMELDSRGHYELKSEVTLWLNSTLTVTAELRLRVLDQSFTKSLTLHPPPVCCVMPAEKRNRFFTYPLLLMLLGVVLLLSWKRSEQETKKDEKTQE